MSDPTDLDFYPVEMENLRDAQADDAFFERQCPSINSAGERCAFTIHFTGLHTWEQK